MPPLKSYIWRNDFFFLYSFTNGHFSDYWRQQICLMYQPVQYFFSCVTLFVFPLFPHNEGWDVSPLKDNFPSCCYLLSVQALSVCPSCEVLATAASWQLNERSHRSSSLLPGDTPRPHSVTIKTPQHEAENLKNGPLLTATGIADTIKGWYRLQIMHVCSLILIYVGRSGTEKGCVWMWRCVEKTAHTQ